MGFKTKEEERAYNKAYYQKHKDDIKVKARSWVLSNKSKRAEYNKKYTKENKEKKRLYDMQYRAENAEKLKAKREEDTRNGKKYKWFRDWWLNNPEKRDVSRYRRQKRLAYDIATLTDDQWLEIKEKYLGICVCCLEKKKLTIDHVLPVSKGGQTEYGNIQPLCKSCNSSKKDKYIDYRKDFQERLATKLRF